jgi:hypothetical protein
MILSFTQMMLSQVQKLQEGMRSFAESEPQFRCIAEGTDSSLLNWRDETGDKGTASLVPRTRMICKKMEVGLKLNEEDDCVIVNTGE